MTDSDADEREIHYSEANAFRKCPQAWNYAYVQNLTSTVEAQPIYFEFGSWWHALRAADSISRGRRSGTLIYAPEALGTGDTGPSIPVTDKMDKVTVLDAAAVFWKSMAPEMRDAWIEANGGPLVERLMNMDDRWLWRWKTDLLNEEVLAVEVKTRRALPGTSIVQVGRVDEVYRDKKRNLVVARDHKTAKTIPPMTALDDMMDSQLHLYAWSLVGTVPDLKVNAVAYDRARSKAPSQPSVTINGTLSKSTTDYDLATYRLWAMGPDGKGVPWGEDGEEFKSGPRKGQPKFGRYVAEDKVLAELAKPEHVAIWNDRTLVPLNNRIVRAHVIALYDTVVAAEEMRTRIEKTGEAPRNLTRMGCSMCQFSDLCRAQMIGGPEGDYPLEEFGLMHRQTDLDPGVVEDELTVP